tara:strand:+ start:306 stop:1010 length:705 start_codon:yes stop_codon:yes gene_type:complete
MAQHDYDIANASGASVRADLNSMADAMVSNNSGSTEPTTKLAYMWWADTTTGLMKQRNGANNAWLTRGSLTSSVVPAFESTGIDDNATSTQLTVTDTGILTDGVYLGGTGAANKLDDYEEGAWIPTTATGTLTATTARYTKVGRKVTIILEAISFSDTTSAAAIAIGGLPFTVEGTGNGAAMWQYNGKPSDNAYCVTVINFYSGDNSSNFVPTKHSDLLNAANSVYLTATYFAA